MPLYPANHFTGGRTSDGLGNGVSTETLDEAGNLTLAGSVTATDIKTTAGFELVTFNYTPTSVDSTIFTARRAYTIVSITGRPDVIGSDGSAVSAVLKKAASGTAISAGTAVSNSYDLKGTANTNQGLTVSNTAVPNGTSVGVDFTGTLTAAYGCITITLALA